MGHLGRHAQLGQRAVSVLNDSMTPSTKARGKPESWVRNEWVDYWARVGYRNFFFFELYKTDI